MMKLLFAAALVVSSAAALAAAPNDASAPYSEHRYNYNFPAGQPTPFDVWNTDGAKGQDPKAAEFAADFAAKLMTIVTRVEDTQEGKRAFVVVADQHCLIDFVPFDKGYRAVSSKCSTKPFGQF